MDLLRLADAVGPINGLLLDERVPVRLLEDNVVGNVQVESSVALLKRSQSVIAYRMYRGKYVMVGRGRHTDARLVSKILVELSGFVKSRTTMSLCAAVISPL